MIYDTWDVKTKIKVQALFVVNRSFELNLVSPYFFEALEAIGNQIEKLEPRYLCSIQHD